MTEQYLIHHGVKGQKWGVRRYQNPDGTLTAAGKQRYYRPDGKMSSEGKSAYKQIKKDTANKYRKEKFKKTFERFRELSTGKKLLELMVYGPFGTVTYNNLRANNVSKGKSFVATAFIGPLGAAIYTDFKANKAGKNEANRVFGR